MVGHGRAAKSQVQEMVRRLLQLPGLPGTDAADGLAWPLPTPTRVPPWAAWAKGCAEPPPARHAYKGGRSYWGVGIAPLLIA